MTEWRAATLDEPVLAPLRRLRAVRDHADVVIVEGEIAVARALEAGWPIEVVLATEPAARRLPPLPEGALGRIGSQALLESVTGFAFHRGCLAVLRRPVQEDPAARLRALASAPAPWTIVIAEALADPVNVGALVRNARAFGALAVVLAGGADPLSARAVRASMGHVFAQPLVQVDRTVIALRAITEVAPDASFVAATTGARARRVDEVAAPSRLVLMVGAEGPGLSPDALAQAHVEVTIPTAIDSINVAAATAVLLWQLRRDSARQGS